MSINLLDELKDIEKLSRVKFGSLDPVNAYEHFLKELDELRTAQKPDDFVHELFDVFAMGYAFMKSTKRDHSFFVTELQKKIKIVKERMNR